MSDAVLGEVPTQSSFTAFPRIVPARSYRNETAVTSYQRICYDRSVAGRRERHRAEFRSTRLTNDKCRPVPNSTMRSVIRRHSRREPFTDSSDVFGFTETGGGKAGSAVSIICEGPWLPCSGAQQGGLYAGLTIPNLAILYRRACSEIRKLRAALD